MNDNYPCPTVLIQYCFKNAFLGFSALTQGNECQFPGFPEKPGLTPNFDALHLDGGKALKSQHGHRHVNEVQDACGQFQATLDAK